jgi:hypothetical protein
LVASASAGGIAKWFEQVVMIESGHPLQCGMFDGFARLSGSAAGDQLSLVVSIDGRSQGFVLAVALLTTHGSTPASA